MTIQELIARQQAIVSGARAAGRDLTAEERAEFDGLQRQIDAAGNNPPAQGNEGQGGEDPTGGARGMGNDNGQQGTDPTEAARQAVATERQRVSDIRRTPTPQLYGGRILFYDKRTAPRGALQTPPDKAAGKAKGPQRRPGAD